MDKGSPIFTINGEPFGPVHTVDQVKARNARVGQTFFSVGNMRGFSTRLSETAYPVRRTGGVYFVTSECAGDGHPRLFTVWYCPPSGQISRASQFQQFASGNGAHGAARRLRTHAERFTYRRSPHDVPRLLNPGSDDYRTHYGVIEVGESIATEGK